MSEPIAELRDSAGVDRTAMFDRQAHFLFALVGEADVGWHSRPGHVLARVFLPELKRRPVPTWNKAP